MKKTILIVLSMILFYSCNDVISPNNINVKKYQFISSEIGTKYIYSCTYNLSGKSNDFDTVTIKEKKPLFSLIFNKWVECYILNNPIDYFNAFYVTDSVLFKGWVVKDSLVREIIKINIVDLAKSSTDYTALKKVDYFKGVKFIKETISTEDSAYFFEELINNKYYKSAYADSIGLVYYQETNSSTGKINNEFYLKKIIKP